jgi:hypothetical protein
MRAGLLLIIVLVAAAPTTAPTTRTDGESPAVAGPDALPESPRDYALRLEKRSLREALDRSRESIARLREHLKDLRDETTRKDATNENLVRRLDRLIEECERDHLNELHAVCTAHKTYDGVEWAMISVGSKNGAEEGARFAILDEDGHQVATLTLNIIKEERSIGRLSGPNMGLVRPGLEASGVAKEGFGAWEDPDLLKSRPPPEIAEPRRERVGSRVGSR